MNKMATIIKGFNTVGNTRAPYTLSDLELVQRDLLNEFYTRKGERVMRPNFGSIIWDLLMNPQDDFTEDEIVDDIKRIVGKDPRVELVDITVFTTDASIRAEVALRYILLDRSDVLYLEFIDETR